MLIELYSIELANQISVKLEFIRSIFTMSTRKSRLNTDSPTPNSGSAESVASTTTTTTTTPTTPSARAKRSVRNKKADPNETSGATGATDASINIKTEKIDDDEEAVKDSIEDDDKTDETKKCSGAGIVVTRKRRITTAKDDLSLLSGSAAASSDTSSPTTTDDGKTSPSKVKRSRRSAIEILTGNKSIDTPRIGKRRNSTGKIEKPARKLSSRIKKLTQLRKANMKRALLKKPGRPPQKASTNVVIAAAAAAVTASSTSAKKAKSEKNSDSTSDSELMKISRRRSDSVSKCSDMTDTSSFQEMKETDDAEAMKNVDIKQEVIDKDEDVCDRVTRSTSDSGIGNDATDNSDECKRPQTRQTRRNAIVFSLPPKVMNTRSRSETPSDTTTTSANATPSKTVGQTDDSNEATTATTKDDVKEIKKEKVETPLHVETVAADSNAAPVVEESEVETTQNSNVKKNSAANADAVGSKSDVETSESLSPVLVSEGLSEISVKQFYGRPEFLENNLGIEKDPKLGDIVQVQEKIKSGTTDNGCSDNHDNDDQNRDRDNEKVETMDVPVEEATPTIKQNDEIVEKETPKESKENENEDIGEEEEEEYEDDDDDDDVVEVAQTTEKAKSTDATDTGDCFVKPNEQVRKNSTSLLNENLLLNGEIEVRPKENKGTTRKADADVVSEVVLYTITTNGMRVNPEKLEKIIESHKQKEKDEQLAAHANGDSNDDTESIKLDGTTITKIEDPIEIEDNEPSWSELVATDVVTAAVAHVDKTEQMDVDMAVESKENVDKSNHMAVVVPASLSTSNKSSSRSSSIEDETVEDLKQKESHLKTLGLLTHQAAEEATIEKQKRREQLKASIASSSTAGGKGKKNTSEYTGTLKTVIKLHRGGGGSSGDSKKKGNLPLKMTLHKGRAKNGGSGHNSNNDRNDSHSAANSEEDTYYTIQNQDMDGHECDILAEEAAAKECAKLLVIPEKASSFRYHPEKLCDDQCCYCRGKFGLFDTPCHIAQIKSVERQKKILDNEEKLTVDSCLCDACFRHVDRSANCASYKKRLAATATVSASLNELETSATESDEKALQQNPNATISDATLFQSNKEPMACLVAECTRRASHSLRRKWALKLRKTIGKSIAMNFDNTNSQTFLPICDKHCDDIGHMLVCVLCKHKLKRRHSYFINKDSNKLEPLLSAKGIPVVISSASVVCKLCHLYVNLLLKPQDVASGFAENYTYSLLEYYQRVEMVDDDSENDQSRRDHGDEPSSKRARVPKRGRKSSTDLYATSSATNSDDGSKYNRTNADLDATGESHYSRAERQRHKSKQQQQQQKLPQLMTEQQRVEQRVQHEQMKLKQQELLQQKQQEELRQAQLRTSNEDISNLRTNPNISMRELFPGEEEMGLNVSIPFTTSSWRTPDGWSKVTSTVQYDEPTRRLWEDLQKPYGNQSSFLRHLILLEKYFRNGDLVLAPNANLNAATYAESIQHRLQSYDNIPPRAISLTQLQSTSAESSGATTVAAKTFNVPKAAAVTITKAAAGTPNATDAVANNSLLKSNASTSNSSLQRRGGGSGSSGYNKNIEAISNSSSLNDTQTKSNSHTSTKNETTKTSGGNSSGGSSSHGNTSNASSGTPKNNKSSIGLPPELICINTSTPNDKHQQQLLSQMQYQTQMQLTLQQHLQQQHQNSLLLTQHKLPSSIVQPAVQLTPPKKSHTPSAPASAAAAAVVAQQQSNSSASRVPGIIRLPGTLTEAEKLEGKMWRPTLMPVSTAQTSNHNDMYLTADGRSLPSLVQVHSSGKPYVISIHDYNRMCIMRRERFQEQMSKSKTSSPPTQSASNASTNNSSSKKSSSSSSLTPLSSSTITSGLLSTVGSPPPPLPLSSSTLSLSSSSLANLSGSATPDAAAAKKVQIPDKILQQNSLIPLNASIKSMSNDNNITNDSLLKSRNKHQSSLLKTNASNTPKLSVSTAMSGHNSVTATVFASNSAKLPLSITSALSQSNIVSITSAPSIQLVPQPITITSVSSLPMTNVAASAAAAATNNVQNNVSALEALFKTTNQVTTTPTTMWQWAESLNKSNSGIGLTPIDNSTKSILSKIPKSLTVIPQQKRLSSKGADDN